MLCDGEQIFWYNGSGPPAFLFSEVEALVDVGDYALAVADVDNDGQNMCCVAFLACVGWWGGADVLVDPRRITQYPPR